MIDFLTVAAKKKVKMTRYFVVGPEHRAFIESVLECPWRYRSLVRLGELMVLCLVLAGLLIAGAALSP